MTRFGIKTIDSLLTGNLLALLLALLALAPLPAQAVEARIKARITPTAGAISDAAMLTNERVALVYPAEGRIAVYNLAGELIQHFHRETGEDVRFVPTACASTESGGLYVFDEATYKVFAIAADGNIQSGINLAYPGSDGQLYALSMVGDLDFGPGDVLWATLPERSLLAGFDLSGKLLFNQGLEALLPYENHSFSRAQVLDDHSLFLLDFTQGAVLYRTGAAGGFKRLRLDVPTGESVVPQLQDFAVDNRRVVLLASYEPDQPVRILVPGTEGYSAHKLQLGLPAEPQRLAVRADKGTFIVWTKDNPTVFLIEVEL